MRLTLLAVCFFVLTAWIFPAGAPARELYVSPSGSDSNDGSSGLPLVTFQKAMGMLGPGDTLILKDGTYYQTLDITASGTPSAPVSVRAENDGGAVIDGQNVRPACRIYGTPDSAPRHDIEVSGIQCRNSSGEVFYIYGADRIRLRRVSGYNAGSGNQHVFSVNMTNDVLLEDCAASGSGRQMYNIMSSERSTLRRCWGRWQGHSGGGGPNGFMQIYGSNHSIVENCIGTMDPSVTDEVQGAAIWANYYNPSANYNKFFGNVIYGLNFWAYIDSSVKYRIYGNRFVDNVSIDNRYGFLQKGDADLKVDRMTIVGSDMLYGLAEDPYEPKEPDFAIKGYVKNSILLSGQSGFSISSGGRIRGFKSENNAFYKLKRPYAGMLAKGRRDIKESPRFDTARYGRGGYLFVPGNSPLKKSGKDGGQVGASVLYRYENGVLTKTPLWPWPMEDRIMRETGVSVTWEAKGGLWKTLDGVYN